MSKVFLIERADYTSLQTTLAEITSIYGDIRSLFTDAHLNIDERVIATVVTPSNDFLSDLRKLNAPILQIVCDDVDVDGTLHGSNYAVTAARVEPILNADILFVECFRDNSTSLIALVKQARVANDTSQIKAWPDFVEAVTRFGEYIEKTYGQDRTLLSLAQAVVNTRAKLEK